MCVLTIGRAGSSTFGYGMPSVARVGDDAGERRGGRGLRAAQEHAVLARAGAAREIARHRAQAVAARGRRLPHADAAVAAGLVDARAGADEIAEQALGDRGSPAPGASSGLMSKDTRSWTCRPRTMCGRDGEVAVARIGRGADVGLVDLRPGDLAHRHDVAGARRLGDQRLERREVDLLVNVVGRALVGAGFPPSPPRGPRRAGTGASPRRRGRRSWWRPAPRPCWR